MLLITGVTSQTGPLFLEKLLSSDPLSQVRVIIRSKEIPSFLKKSNIEVIHGDLTDHQILERALEGIDTVLHIAGILMSQKIVEIGQRKGVQWFILVHTTGRFSKFRSASSEYISIEDSLIKNYHNLTILRPTMIYGSQQDRNIWKLIRFIDKFKVFPIFGSGKNLMQPVHSDDLAGAYLSVLKNKEITMNQQYDLSGQKPIQYKELLQTVSKELNIKTFFIHFPMIFCLSLAKAYEFIFRKFAIIRYEQVLRLNEDKAFSHEKAQKEFGFSPRSFEEGVRQEVRLFRARKGLPNA